MEKYDFTKQHLYGENHNHITKIISILQASNVEDLFVRKFYATVPMLDLTEEDYHLYAQLAKNAFDFLQNRNISQAKLKLYQGVARGVESDHTIIEILSDDLPFLFDSTICLLNRLNIEVEKVAHPTIFVSRDEKGKLVSIDDKGAEEIIIQIRTAHCLSKELSQLVENELKHILSVVKYAVHDWKNIVGQLDVYTTKFVENLSPEKEEQREFLELMKSKYFVFLGSAAYDFDQQGKHKIVNDSILGILKPELDQFEPLFASTIFTNGFFTQDNGLIYIGKLNKISVVHRDANIDYLCLKVLDNEGNLKKALVFIGLFTSILYYQSATLIPIIRGKLDYILKKAGFSSHSHAGKELVSIVESLPRDELFQTSAEELYPLIMEIYALLFSPELRLFTRIKGDTLSCLLFLPIELSNADNVKKLKAALAFEFGPIVGYHFTQINNSRLCYYHFFIDTRGIKVGKAEFDRVERELRTITKLWEDSLYELLFREYGKNKGRKVFDNFGQAFPVAYKDSSLYSKTIIEDIENISSLISGSQIIFKIIPSVEGKVNIAQFKIYHIDELNLSAIMPMLQNMGLNVVAEQIYIIQPYGKSEVWLHQFVLKVNEVETKMLEIAKENIEEAFLAMWQGKCQNDLYNQLISKANLNHRQVTLLRAFAEYLYQIKIGYSREYIGQVLDKHFEVAKKIISLFYAMFSPKLKADDRANQIAEIEIDLEQSLGNVHDNVEDQIIRRLIDLVHNILRTNYFLHDELGGAKDYISIKINSDKIMNMPLPRPHREVFVYSASFEAIHLRGGKVARGGLRWSDRAEDYRTEVLGLMKTQVVKNSVIVPTGAKGGFLLKNVAGLSREELQARAIECYQNFLRGLLDITDNIIDGKTHHPKNIVHYDGEDPYLVVAADKGTATFSDIANQISLEYKFWLGDAFASGGSKGYDHKKMGITAKGGWISVVRHFHEMGIDINNADFTVIGIGDMAGDVFGNGMLLSSRIKLLGAFNHMHIFIDPNPDAAKSFAERQRLFELPRSTWMDYNPESLSKGAQIYERKAKQLQLTPEIKELFNLKEDTIKPDELIKVLLKAEVDLLWNGGIGTYVKSSFETNEQVGDKTNDNLRCNGEELRCKIVGEGGNLGFTQYGRIEYARKGGRINTDAIDNSAGVDCSDHEVNIKIALHQAINKGQITEEERVAILESMTDNVAELVLKDNRTQTRALTIAQQQGYDILGQQEHFINILEEYGILDRKIECLPSKQQFTQLYTNKKGLTRPELSVLLAYSKNAVYNNLIETNLPEEKYFYDDLLAYFPEQMRERFANILENHPLRREIIATTITNSMINRVDTFYLHLAIESTGHKFCDIARAYTVTRDLFNLRDLWKEINTLDGVIPVKDQVQLYIVIKKFVMRSTNWLLRNYHGKIEIASAIEVYQAKINELYSIIGGCLTGKFKDNHDVEREKLFVLSVPQELACKIAILSPLSSAYNIIEVSNRYKAPVTKVADIYFELGNRFSIDWLRSCANDMVAENNWQKLAIRGYKDELYDVHRRITASAVDHAMKNNDSLEKWHSKNEKHIRLFDRFIEEVKSQETIEYEMIDLSLKKLSVLLDK
jgi:glutamate dehydrogenase